MMLDVHAATPAQKQEVRAISEGWWILLVWGILTVLMGLYIVANPEKMALVGVTLLGAYFVVGGIMDIVSAIVQRETAWVWRLVVGIVYVAAGMAVLGSPLLATVMSMAVLYFVLAFSAVFGGIVEIIRAVTRIGKVGFGAVLGTLLLGILQLAIGLFLLENPVAGTLALMPVLGIFAIASGIVAMIGAFQVKGLAARV